MQPKSASLAPQRPPRVRHKPDALMYVTMAFLWVSVWRFQDLFSIIGKLQIPLALEGSLLLLVVTGFNGARDLKWIKSRVFALPFVLLALMIAGLAFSLWPGKSITFIVKDFIPSLLLMVGVAMSIREADDLNWFAFAHLVGATVYATYIFLFIPVGAGGRLGELVYYDANDFGLLVVCSVPFAIYFLRPTVTLWKRLFALLSLGLFVVMLIKSGSRGGFIAFVVVMAYVISVFRAIPARLRIGAVVIGLAIMVSFGSATYWDMMGTLLHPKQDYNMTSETGRKSIWKRGIGYMFSHPVLGVGVAAFEQAEGTLSAISQEYSAQNRGLKWSTAHNSFVLVGAELGVGGLILFVSMIGTSFYHMANLRGDSKDDPIRTPEDTAFAQTLIAALLGFCVAGFFVSAAYFSFLYALIGLVVAVDSFAKRRLARGMSTAAVASLAAPPAAPTHRYIKKGSVAAHWYPSR